MGLTLKCAPASIDIILQVDDSDSTQQTVGQLIASMFDVKFGFHGFFMNTLAKVRFPQLIRFSKLTQFAVGRSRRDDPRY